MDINTITKEQMLDYYISKNYTIKEMCRLLNCTEAEFFTKTRKFNINKKKLMKKIRQREIEKETDFILSKNERKVINIHINKMEFSISNVIESLLKSINRLDYNIVNRGKDKRYTTEGGIYFFYNDKYELIYLGKATNFWLRYRQHMKLIGYDNSMCNNTYYYSDEFAYFKFVPIKEKWMQDIIETCLINKLQPKYNVAKKYVS